jgi:hypothetical protein
VNELERNHQRQAPTPLRNRAHSPGFQMVSHGTFVGRKSKVRRETRRGRPIICGNRL